MGYCMSMVGQNFLLPAKKSNDALKALKKLAIDMPSISWVENSTVLNAVSLDDAMREFMWEVERETHKDGKLGDITYLYFNGEKLGDDHRMFEAIAPFVKDGSYIEMHGEDGERWRWVFKKGKCKEVTATFEFEDED